MKGWLVVNGFLKSDKFQTLYSFFQNSARQLNIGLQVVPSDELSVVTGDDLPLPHPDFVLFWDKDVTLAKRLEKLGLKLFNSAHAVETCDSKVLTALALEGIVPMPATVFSPKTFEGVGYPNTNFVRRAAEKLGLPLVVKEACGSFGQQVRLCQTLADAENAAQQLAGKDFLLQQFVAESCGRDIRVNVVGGRAVNAILRKSSNGDFRSNVTLGGTMQPHELSQEERFVAERAVAAIGLSFAGVDLLLGKNGPLLCEINSNPHFKSTFDCTGVDMSKLILQHVEEQMRNNCRLNNK